MKLSIVLNLKNRSKQDYYYKWNDRTYHLRQFPNCIETMLERLKEFKYKDETEIIIIDWSQDDINLNKYIMELFSDIQIRIEYPDTDIFNISVGKNTGAEKADGYYILFIDVDMFFMPYCKIFDRIEYAIDNNYIAYFPHCRYGQDPSNIILSDYVVTAFGNMLIKKKIFSGIKFLKKDALNRQEDVKMYKWLTFLENRYKILEENVNGFIHQFHI